MFGIGKSKKPQGGDRRAVSEVMGVKIGDAMSTLSDLREQNLADAQARRDDKRAEIEAFEAEVARITKAHEEKQARLQEELAGFEAEVYEAERWLTAFGELPKPGTAEAEKANATESA